MPNEIPIHKLIPLSVAKICASYYGFWGLVTACIYLIKSQDVWYAPLGVWTMFYFAKINLILTPEHNILAKSGDLFWLTLMYTVTGWLSGLVLAVIYNLCSNFLGLQLMATIREQSDTQKSS
jgi:hypothetical protein